MRNKTESLYSLPMRTAFPNARFRLFSLHVPGLYTALGKTQTALDKWGGKTFQQHENAQHRIKINLRNSLNDKWNSLF
jgi:hypothetical protein